ncbi:Hypothetical predicted protein, partial [Pelobates cultripes]
HREIARSWKSKQCPPFARVLDALIEQRAYEGAYTKLWPPSHASAKAWEIWDTWRSDRLD